MKTAGYVPKFAEANFRDDTSTGHCVECGRKVGKNPWLMEIINGGEVAGNPLSNDLNDSGYMGIWAVGNECAKEFDKAVLFKETK
jgi:hypothetical protein